MNKCFECESIEDLQEHHVVPKSRGGTKTVTLCYKCHMKSHGRSGKGLDHCRLTKEGIARAKAKGVKLGSQNSNNQMSLIKSRKKQKESADQFALRVIKYIDINKSLRENAKILEDLNILTFRGKKKWQPKSVMNIIYRYKKLEEK